MIITRGNKISGLKLMKQSLELKITLHAQPAPQSLIRSYTKLSPRWTSAMVRRPLFGMTPGIIDALADRFSALHSHCKNSLVAQVSLLLECRIPSSWCHDTHLRRLRELTELGNIIQSTALSVTRDRRGAVAPCAYRQGKFEGKV